MDINIFTLVAQIINFLILVGLLWYFLFGRIVRAMNEREEKITSRIEEAEKRKSEAEEEKKSYQDKKEELESQREDILKEAKEKAEEKRKQLVEEAREEVEERKNEWQQSLQNQKESFLSELRQRAGKEIYTAVRKVLNELANQDVEKKVVDVFIKKIHQLDESKQKEISEVVQESDESAVISSAFELSDETRKNLTEVIRNQFGSDIELEFETSSDLILGVEFKVNDYRIAWNLENYLDRLEERLSEELGEESEEE